MQLEHDARICGWFWFSGVHSWSTCPAMVCVLVIVNFASSLTLDPFTKPPKTRNEPSLMSLITWSSRGNTSCDWFYSSTHEHEQESCLLHRMHAFCIFYTYWGVDWKPSICVGIKEEDLAVAVFTLQAAIENNFFSWAHWDCMVRDSARATAWCLDELPFRNLVEVAIVFHQGMDTGQVEAPHCCYGAFL